MELLLIHDSTEPKVRNQQVCIIFWCAKKKVLGFQVAMHNAMVVEICNCGENGADKVCSIGFKVRTFSTDSIEEFATEGEICYKVDCIALGDVALERR
jgi:hypothetical protein